MSEDHPPCHVCGKFEDILSWHPEHPERAVCPTCCETTEHFDGETGHQYEYERGDRTYYCQYCGIPASDDWLADRANP